MKGGRVGREGLLIRWWWVGIGVEGVRQGCNLSCCRGIDDEVGLKYWNVEGLKRFLMVLVGWVMIWNFLRVLPWVEIHGTCRHAVPNLFIFAWSGNFQGFQAMPLKEIYGECYWLPWGSFIRSLSGSAWNHALVIFMAYLWGMWVSYTFIQTELIMFRLFLIQL